MYAYKPLKKVLYK